MSDNSPRRGISVDLHVGDDIQLDVCGRPVDSEKIRITLEQESGQKARLRIQAGDSVTILRTSVKRAVPA